jgi:hypothetical protein
VLLVPLFELSRHAWVVAHVPSDADYRAAASFVRAELQPHDLITSAPAFIDPIVRLHLGDHIPLDMAGRSDDAAYERMWVVSIRGALAPGAPHTPPDIERQFGPVRVQRFGLGKSRVLFDFWRSWSSAAASLTRQGVEQSCSLRSGGVPRGGGLGKGVLLPLRQRFECDPEQSWLSMGPVVMEDLDNTPRACIWQHPRGEEPVTLRYANVPLGDQLVFYAGLYYEHERMRQGGAIEASLSIAGKQRALFRHRDGEGWKRWLVDTRDLAGQSREVSVAVRAQQPYQRSFCWTASTRRADAEAP